MIYFAQAQYLFLLLLVPVFPVLYGLMQYRRTRRIRKFGDEKLVNELMPSRSRTKGWVRNILFSLAFMFFVIGLSRPQMGAKLKEHQSKGAEVMIALDVSNSMLARDYSPNRLERAKLAISRLVDKLDGDRVGLVLFAGTSFVQLPITTDYVSAKMFLGNISTESIIVITDGENHEDDPVAAAKQAADMGIMVYTIGVGSQQGQPIPMKNGLLKDSEGNIVVTKLDENTLEEVAKAGNGAYVHAGNDEFGLNPVINDIRKLDEEEFKSIVFEEYDEQFMYFFAIALGLLVIQMLIGERKVLRHLFDKR